MNGRSFVRPSYTTLHLQVKMAPLQGLEPQEQGLNQPPELPEQAPPPLEPERMLARLELRCRQGPKNRL